MTPLVGFAPDSDTTIAGVITDCRQLIPCDAGMRSAPNPVPAAALDALPQACKGAAVLEKPDGSRRVLVGTANKLYEITANAWKDVSPNGGIIIGEDERLMFAQYGNTTVAASIDTTLMKSISGAFTAIKGAPKAKIAFTVGAFVMLLNTSEAHDQWHCCAAYDVDKWTTSIDTQCAKGRLVATNGALTAGARLGEYAVAYKANSIYIGQYVGAPAVWQWLQVSSGNAGCVGQEALCDIGGAHFFVSDNGFFVFDGAQTLPIGEGQVKHWFLQNSSAEYRYKTSCYYDAPNSRVWIFYPSKDSNVNDSAIVWHTKSKMWGRADRRIESVVNYVTNAQTYDTLDTVAPTYDALPNISFDSPFWLHGSRSMAVFDGEHRLCLMHGGGSPSYMVTGDYGDDSAVTRLKRIRLRYVHGKGPSAATTEVFLKMNSGDTARRTKRGVMHDGKFDVMQVGRWHRVSFSFEGDVQIVGILADYVTAGQR